MLVISVIPLGLAKTRQNYIIQFVKSTQLDEFNGFSNSVIDKEEVSFEATAVALEIIDHYKIPELELNISKITANLTMKLDLAFNQSNIDIYKLSHALKAFSYLDYNFTSILENKINTYLNKTYQSIGGFSPTNSSTQISMASTFYAIECYRFINKSIPEPELIKNWTLDCLNLDGGYGGNSTLSSAISNTYFAINILNLLGYQSEIQNKSKTIEYLKSFYFDEIADDVNYGGFLPNDASKDTQLSSTYFCVQTLANLSEIIDNKDDIISWVLKRQNYRDGGFSDIKDGNIIDYSSMSATYYAFEILKTLNPNLEQLNEDVFAAEFNWWILIILFIVIGAVVVVGYFIWRRRQL